MQGVTGVAPGEKERMPYIADEGSPTVTTGCRT